MLIDSSHDESRCPSQLDFQTSVEFFVATRHVELLTLDVPEGEVSSIALSRENHWLAAGISNGTIKVWPARWRDIIWLVNS